MSDANPWYIDLMRILTHAFGILVYGAFMLGKMGFETATVSLLLVLAGLSLLTE